MNKILVAEPIYHAIPPEIYHNRIAFWKETFGGEDIGEIKVRPCTIGPRVNIREARDQAIQTAIDEQATHLFFIDDDVEVPNDILAKLLTVGRPVVGALIHRDNGDPLVFRPVTFADNPGALEAYCGYPIEEIVWKDHPKSGAFECAAVAPGCMLIQVEVLKKLKGSELFTWRWLFNYDDTPRSMGVNFCRKVRAAGFSVWCLPDRPCAQIKHHE